MMELMSIRRLRTRGEFCRGASLIAPMREEEVYIASAERYKTERCDALSEPGLLSGESDVSTIKRRHRFSSQRSMIHWQLCELGSRIQQRDCLRRHQGEGTSMISDPEVAGLCFNCVEESFVGRL